MHRLAYPHHDSPHTAYHRIALFQHSLFPSLVLCFSCYVMPLYTPVPRPAAVACVPPTFTLFVLDDGDGPVVQTLACPSLRWPVVSLRCAISTATVYVREVVDKYLGLGIRRPHASLARLATSFLSRRYATLVHAGRRRPPVDPVHPRRGGARSPRCYSINMMRRGAGCYSYLAVLLSLLRVYFLLFLGIQFLRPL